MTVHSATARKVAAKRGLLTSRQVVERSGLSYRQLDFWTTNGLIEAEIPSDGPGTARLFDPAVVEVIRNLQARIKACPFRHKQGA